MGREIEEKIGARIDAVRAGIERWRTTRPKSRSMPDILWREAVSLARQQGVYRVACALAVDYGALKQRTGETAIARRCDDDGTVRGAGLVEPSGAQLLASSSSAAGHVVEVADGDGARLTVRLAAGAVLDVATLAGTFRARRS